MLKHVQISPHRNRSDSVSLRSSISSSSSLCGSPEPHDRDSLRPSSRASSYCSLNETMPQTTIKVFTSCLKLDIEYKTLGLRWDTTSKDVVQQILRRCKMRQRDSRLFYLSMEVMVRKAGVKTVIALDDDARPAILQACHPKGDSRFCLQIKPGGLIRVHTSVLQPTSLYKSLFISEETTSDELLTLLLSCYNLDDPVEQFSLYEVCPAQEYQRKLHPDDLPLRAQQQRTQRGEQCHFIVRKNPHFIARQRRQSLLLSPIVETHKSTTMATATATVTGNPTKLMENEVLNGGNRYTDDNNNGTGIAVFHKNCVRELNYSRLTRVPTTEHLNETHDDDAIQNSCTSNSFIKTAASITNINNNNNNTVAVTAPTVVTTTTPNTSTYCPVYNIREIRTVCNSFSALGIDKKLWDLDCKPSSSLASMTAASRHSVAGVTATSMNIVREAVNNNPAKGYGSYVYI